MINAEWPLWGSLSPDLAIQRREEAAVGRIVFIHDQNNRVYLTKNSGSSPRHHFVPRPIVGETRVSWLIGWERRPDKHSKKAPLFFGLLDVEDYLWASEYRYRISQRVGSLSDVQTLKAIAKMVGFEPGDQP